MIPLTINKKKVKIKSIDELTTKEFIELSHIENCDTVKYIAWQTGLTFNDAFFVKSPKSLEKQIGIAPDITKLPTLILDYVDYSKMIETVGQRHQVEESKLQGYELLVHCLAVSQAQSMNIDDVNRIKDIYLEKPFKEILPAGFFFFKIYRDGRGKGLIFLTWLMELIRTWRLRSKRGLSV